MTPLLLDPGPLTGDRLLGAWPRLRPYLVAAIHMQEPDIAGAMVTVLAADETQLRFTVRDDAVVAAIAGREFASVPVLALIADDGAEAH